MKEVIDAITELKSTVQSLSQPNPAVGYTPAAPNHVRKIGDRPYSFQRAMSLSLGIASPETAPEEVEVSRKLRKMGFQSMNDNSLLMPIGINFMPRGVDDEYIFGELAQRVNSGVAKADPDEMAYLNKRFGKTLGPAPDNAGGTLVGFPTLGDVIDLQRNLEVFVNAGASEVALPLNAKLTYPKLTSGVTCQWLGAGQTGTPSTPGTGSVSLDGKKLMTLVLINNELLRFAGPSTEAMVRNDMARETALTVDLASLTGTGGTSIQGLYNYARAQSWTQGTDFVIDYQGSSMGADGNTLQPEDIYGMEAALPDEVEATAWVGRRNFFGKILNRRAGSGAGASTGLFMFDAFRTGMQAPIPTLTGAKIVRSSQVSSSLTKGSGTGLTYLVVGRFSDWLIGRYGVAELTMSNQAGNAFVNDQTYVRMIQTVDAAPRHAASFCIYDKLINS